MSYGKVLLFYKECVHLPKNCHLGSCRIWQAEFERTERK